MALHLLQVPYDSGQRARRMGLGPLCPVERGALDRLRRVGRDVCLIPVEAEAACPTGIGTAFELYRSVSEAVAAAVRGGALPLVPSGNRYSAAGTVSGLQAAASDGLCRVAARCHVILPPSNSHPRSTADRSTRPSAGTMSLALARSRPYKADRVSSPASCSFAGRPHILPSSTVG